MRSQVMSASMIQYTRDATQATKGAIAVVTKNENGGANGDDVSFRKACTVGVLEDMIHARGFAEARVTVDEEGKSKAHCERQCTTGPRRSGLNKEAVVNSALEGKTRRRPWQQLNVERRWQTCFRTTQKSTLIVQLLHFQTSLSTALTTFIHHLRAKHPHSQSTTTSPSLSMTSTNHCRKGAWM